MTIQKTHKRTKDENKKKPKTEIEFVKDLTERINHIVANYDEKFRSSEKEYDSLVAEFHRYCILNTTDYKNTELYIKANPKMGYFHRLNKNEDN